MCLVHGAHFEVLGGECTAAVCQGKRLLTVRVLTGMRQLIIPATDATGLSPHCGSSGGEEFDFLRERARLHIARFELEQLDPGHNLALQILILQLARYHMALGNLT